MHIKTWILCFCAIEKSMGPVPPHRIMTDFLVKPSVGELRHGFIPILPSDRKRAGEGGRTLDVKLGKLAFYR
jgi:hypothetical protein